jgi:hypothetical protein
MHSSIYNQLAMLAAITGWQTYQLTCDLAGDWIAAVLNPFLTGCELRHLAAD